MHVDASMYNIAMSKERPWAALSNERPKAAPAP